MSQDDDATIERVARAICEATSGPFEMLDDVGRDALRCEARAAITAYLSEMPQRELLAEALSALEPFAEKAGDYHYEDPQHHGIVLISDLRRARAAASRLSEMDAEIKRLREALREIAKQVPAKDMDEDYYEAADFEDGYDRCVFAARAALEHQQQKGEGL